MKLPFYAGSWLKGEIVIHGNFLYMKSTYQGNVLPGSELPADKTLVVICAPFHVLFIDELICFFVKIIAVEIKVMSGIEFMIECGRCLKRIFIQLHIVVTRHFILLIRFVSQESASIFRYRKAVLQEGLGAQGPVLRHTDNAHVCFVISFLQ